MPKEDEYTKVMWEAKRSEKNQIRILEAAKIIAPDLKEGYSGRLGGYMRWLFRSDIGVGLFFSFCWDGTDKRSTIIPANRVIEMISEGLDKPLLLEFLCYGAELSDEETSHYGRRLGETFNILSGKNKEGKILGRLINAIHNSYCELVESQEQKSS